MDRIKRISAEILTDHRESFGADFSENKKMLNQISIVRSKSLKNKIAGYITKILLREQKFQAHKQKLIDDEKKFLERNNVDKKEKTTEPETVDAEPEPAAESTPEPETVDAEPEPAAESTPEPETVDAEPESAQEKTLAEEVLDDAEKSE